jgi:hypothetical protein
MMDPISTVLLLWLASQRRPSGGMPPTHKGAPRWPSTASPPPMPAFAARKTPPPPPPSADHGNTSTPLAELHATPEAPPPASAIEHAKQAATNAIRKKTQALIRKQALSINPFGKKKAAAAPTSTALVANLQAILSNHGVRVARDGLYGPKTASAWASLAKRKGLAPAISREGPKIAKVVTQTFEQLSTPPIP